MILRRLYSLWVILSIAIFFFIFIIPLILCVPFRRLHWLALKINYVWAWGFFKLSLIPLEQIWHFKPEKKSQYVLCANHFSYLDIPALGLFPSSIKFVGKSQLGKIPLFGFMYNHIHVTVNRSSYRSRAKSLAKARDEIKHGFSLGFFPEGGIRLKEYPTMVSFQDGAFRVAAENNTPIIPIVFPDNYHILTDDDVFNMRRKKCRIIYLEPIQPFGQTDEDIKKLKNEVFRVIQSVLNNCN